MHFLESTMQLHNSYWLQRHGQSTANVEGILVSNFIDGTTGYGLTELGRKQVTQQAEAAKALGLGRDKPLVFIVSPFDRAIETAQISQSILGGFIVLDERLRERHFGNYDKQSGTHLQHIWALDSQNAQNTEGNVESPQEVKQRAVQVIQDIEAAFEGYHVVLVSHGDTLQIAQTVFEDLPASSHRRVTHLENAEFRQPRRRQH